MYTYQISLNEILVCTSYLHVLHCDHKFTIRYRSICFFSSSCLVNKTKETKSAFPPFLPNAVLANCGTILNFSHVIATRSNAPLESKLEILLQVNHHFLNQAKNYAACSSRKKGIPELQVVKLWTINKQERQACSWRV